MNIHFKPFLLSSVLTLTGALSTLNAYAAPEQLQVPVTDIFSPKGFDTNDVTQVVISGYLPNLCFKSPKVVAEVKDTVIQVEVTALYEEAEDVACTQATVPFLETISVGVLAEGTYEVRANEGGATFLTDTISVVKAASLETNDFIYARGDYVERIGTTRQVALKGFNPSDCFELSEIRFISNEKNTYSVLPIMKKVRDFCPRKMMPFEYVAEVPASLSVDSILLHTRVMKGDSINYLFDNTIKNEVK